MGWFQADVLAPGGEHALSHELLSVVLMQLLSWLTAASAAASQRHTAAHNVARNDSFCTSVCVTHEDGGWVGGYRVYDFVWRLSHKFGFAARRKKREKKG